MFDLENTVQLALKGIVVGFSAAAPIGPVGLLCISRTLDKGFCSGLISGLGAATANLIFGTLALLFFAGISHFLDSYALFFKLVGGLFLMYMAYNLWNKDYTSTIAAKLDSKDYAKDFFSVFFYIVLNPSSIFFFVSIYTSLELEKEEPLTFLPLYIFGGAALWWTILNAITYFGRKRINIKIRQIITKASSIIIAYFGSANIANTLYQIVNS